MSSPQAVTENNPVQDRPVARALALPAGILASALLFALAVPFWTSLRGVAGPTVMDSERPVLAALVAIAAFAGSTAIAIVVARVVNAVVGTFVLGCGVAILAMRTGAAHDFVYGGTSLAHSAIETAVWGVLVAAASWAIYRFGGRLPDFPATGDAEVDSRRIGERVMDELRQLDQVAYVRFASEYRKFEDVRAFREEIERLEGQPTPEELRQQPELLPEERRERKR